VNSREYYAGVQKAILAAPHVIQTDISFDEVSEEECYIRGVVTPRADLTSYCRFVVTEPEFKRLKYRFHLQTSRQVGQCAASSRSRDAPRSYSHWENCGGKPTYGYLSSFAKGVAFYRIIPLVLRTAGWSRRFVDRHIPLLKDNFQKELLNFSSLIA
jgi:hypothetical protein